MTDGDKGIQGNESLRHLKPWAAGGGQAAAWDQEQEGQNVKESTKVLG
jgi:hypothetical protein